MWSGVALALLGIVLFVISLWNPGGEKADSFRWNYLTLSLQGVIAWGLGFKTIQNEKYFVEWDDESIRWWLPKNKEIETIKISEIRSIEIEKLLVKIGLDDKQKIFNLKFFYYPERKTIQQKFEEIQKSLINGD